MAVPLSALQQQPAQASEESWIESVNPATGESLGRLRAHTPGQAQEAVARARRAQEGWGATPARERARLLGRLRDAIIERGEEIAQTDCKETGKPLTEAAGVTLVVAQFCNYYARLAQKLEGGRRVSAFPLVGKSARIYYRPAGVAAIISPWNYPFFLAMAQVIPALAAGCSVVHKPSEHSPRVGLLVGDLCRQAGFPEDVVQVVLGGGAVGAALIGARVDVAAFTGSPAAGRKVMEAAAKHLTPVVLELGGKDAAIVLDDADLERAANGVAWGAFINAGQTCIATKRAIVAEPVYEKFVGMVAERARGLVPSADPDAQVGALTLESEIGRIERQIRDSVEMGARVAAGGNRLPGPGVFFEPTVLADCRPEMPAVEEETFGPLLTMLRAKDDADAVRIANLSNYGLAGSVWSKDKRRADRVVARFQTGGVAVNDALVQAMNVRLPFGGVKYSGVGRSYGEDGYYHYCNVQSVMRSDYAPSRELLWYPYTPKVRRLMKKLSGLYHGSWSEKVQRLLG